ncbi:hypothetical protein HAX54_005198 [Datura stramonium]|uniref:Uncharacterized protein n=1 Tax=Datura stramonium TaxID=4076 RepID=A0ABS8T930_DATST|nr:hypothetical protein [Datura stramonium]
MAKHRRSKTREIFTQDAVPSANDYPHVWKISSSIAPIMVDEEDELLERTLEFTPFEPYGSTWEDRSKDGKLGVNIDAGDLMQ